jgi:glutathione S-transferase
MLTLCGQSFEPAWTDFGAGVTRTAEWRARVNAMGEIPVLEESGVRLTQTAPILLRLSARYGKFAGDTEDDRFEILRWLFWDNHKLTGYMAPYRFQRAFTPSPDQAVLRFMRGRIDDYLSILEGHLSNRDFVIGAEPTVADISMVGYLLFPKHESGYDLAGTHPSIAAWLSRVRALPGWRSAYDLLPGTRMRCYAGTGTERDAGG